MKLVVIYYQCPFITLKLFIIRSFFQYFFFLFIFYSFIYLSFFIHSLFLLFIQSFILSYFYSFILLFFRHFFIISFCHPVIMMMMQRKKSPNEEYEIVSVVLDLGTREDLLISLFFIILVIYQVFISRSNKCIFKVTPDGSRMGRG